MTRNKRGKAFEREFAGSLSVFEDAHPELWWRRWPDHADWVVLNPKLHAPQAPADYVAVWLGVFYAFELKSTYGRVFNMAWLKRHQRDTLVKLERAGARSYLVFNKRGNRNIKAHAIPIYEYLNVEAECRGEGRRSVPVSTMLECGVDLPRRPGGFVLDGLFK